MKSILTISRNLFTGARGAMGRSFQRRNYSCPFSLQARCCPCGVSIAHGQNPTPSPAAEITPTVEQEPGAPSDPDQAKDGEKNGPDRTEEKNRSSKSRRAHSYLQSGFSDRAGLPTDHRYVFKLARKTDSAACMAGDGEESLPTTDATVGVVRPALSQREQISNNFRCGPGPRPISTFCGICRIPGCGPQSGSAGDLAEQFFFGAKGCG